MITNFFRIKLPFEAFQVQRLPYNEENWRDLKGKYNNAVSFFRNGDFMYLSPSQEAQLELGELVELTVAENPSVVQSLIRHLLFRSFRDAFPNRVPQSFSPLGFFSEREEHDAVRRFLPVDLQGIICFSRLVEAEVRRIVENESYSFGLLIRFRQRWQFNKSLSVLDKEGFELIGKSVLESHAIPGLEHILAPEENLLGEISNINDDIASVKTNSDILERSLNSLYLQRTQSQIGDYLSTRIGEQKTTQIFKNLRRTQTERSSPSRVFSEIQKVASWFSGAVNAPRIYKNADGFCFTVTQNHTFSGSSFRVRSY